MKKKSFTLLIGLIGAITIFAQSPQAFKYQTVVRDNAGNVMANHNVSFRFSILQGSITGTAVYSEMHLLATNEMGLVNLEIGNGILLSGDFSTIDWEADSYFLQVEMDPNGLTNYQLMGTSQLLSVPFAMYSETAGHSETTGDTTRWRKDANNLYFLNGRVGIGTSNPAMGRRLHLSGGDLLVETAQWPDLTLRATEPGGGSSVVLRNGIDEDWENDNYWMMYNLNSEDNKLVFKLNDTRIMAITSDGSMGIGTTYPHESAVFEANSTEKGFLPPRMTTAERDAISSPADGLVIFNTTTDCLNFYAAGYWNNISGIADVQTVSNPTTGETWMDRNLGASQVATSSTDAAAYGDLYQWGRAAEGHESRTSATTTTLATTPVPNGGNAWDGKFITNGSSPYDWLSTQDDNLWQGLSGTNNPCPRGYRLPTEAEWEAERQSWGSNNAAGAFASPLKLPMAGYREGGNGSIGDVGYGGYYRSSTVESTFSQFFFFYNINAYMESGYRGHGFSVRCIKE